MNSLESVDDEGQEEETEEEHNLSGLLSPPNSSNDDVRNSSTNSSNNSTFCPAPECSKTTKSPASGLLHASTEHPEQKLLACEDCGKRFSSIKSAGKHDCLKEKRCDSAPMEVSEDIEEYVDERSESVPFVKQWPNVSLTKKGPVENIKIYRESSMDADQPPVLLNALGFDGEKNPFGFPLPGLLPNFNGNPSSSNSSMPMPGFPFPPQMFPPTIPQFVPPSASTPPRNRAGSAQPMTVSDDDWESMMEVSNVDETEMIRKLVGPSALPASDPNECLLCRRILSCKSALQMHYRTHTGKSFYSNLKSYIKSLYLQYPIMSLFYFR